MNKLIFVILMLMAVSLVYAADTASVAYTLDTQGTTNTLIVKNVPFKVDASLTLNKEGSSSSPTYQIDYYTTVTGAGNSITSGNRRDVLNGCSNNAFIINSADPSNTNAWKYFINSFCGVTDVLTSNNQKRLATYSVTASSAGSLGIDSARTVFTGPGPFNYQTQAGGEFTWTNPVDDTCGNGVVGYLVSGVTDYYSTGKEQCDDGNNANGDGCSAQCNYVEIDWTCSRSNFGDRNSVCSKRDAIDILTDKIRYIVKGDCYPNSNHPARLYCDYQGSLKVVYTSDGHSGHHHLDAANKIKMVANIAAAIKEFFNDNRVKP